MKAGTKSLILFLIIYIGSIAALGSIIGYFYFQNEKSAIIENMRIGMRYKALDINSKLEYYHQSQKQEFVFNEDGYDISLYDSEKKIIASTMTNESIDLSKFFYHKGDDYYLIESLYKQYLGVKYIVIKKELPPKEIVNIKNQIIIFSIYAIAFLLFIAILLSKVMLYPLQNLISSLKTFIKNTTHEMNTPISTILMSYEHFDKKNLEPKQKRSLDRIEIATKTLSNIYNDLTYISFHEHIVYEKTKLNIKEVLLERVKYIDTFIRFKGLSMHCNTEDVFFNIDKRKLTLVIDNLLSNAIKFSKQNGKIEIELTKKYLKIKDYGVGIAKEDQKNIFNRFETSNGFGVGLDIVNNICKEHHIKIVLDSTLSEGSEFKLIWPYDASKSL
ncbi:Two-component system histidine kinase DccS [hydrothermal vent metagenome]|uniref:Two-component system histidine kinase DccS n=1 Tax=hydrothermal vent metagenome TaxID=652676 RepID=A0A1W1ECQ1_9ZZZZ